VRAALEDGRHGDLNRWLKSHGDGERVLAGVHDVEAFVGAIDSDVVRRLRAFLDGRRASAS
jgi:hypothetical protein